MKTFIKNEKGFTLIELMVVIVVIGILASIGLQYVEKAIDKTRVNSDIAQGRRIKESIDVFYTRNGRSPGSITELVSGGFLGGNLLTAQKSGGVSIPINDGTLSSNPVIQINLTSGNVTVKDVTLGSNIIVWESGSI